MLRKLKKETHGTNCCYTYSGCRCLECTEAHRKWWIEWKKNNRAERNSWERKWEAKVNRKKKQEINPSAISDSL